MPTNHHGRHRHYRQLATTVTTAVTTAALAVAAAALFPSPVGAQRWLDKAKQKAKERVEQGKPPQPQPQQQPPADQAGKDREPTSAAVPAGGTASEPPGKGAWLNYDFVPGDRTIWFDDFTGDGVGDFPRRLELIDGNFEVVEVGGKRYLRTAEGGRVALTLPETLPERFTVEVRYYAAASTNYLMFFTSSDDRHATWWCSHDGAGVRGGGGGPKSESRAPAPVGKHDFVDCRFTIDARYVKAYLNEHRLGNLPTANVHRSDRVVIRIPGFGAEHPTLVTDLRIAAGGKKLYDALVAGGGRVATHGILFDVGSDRLRGESTPTLREIGQMLEAHPELRLTIEGHTDDVGDAAANRALSEQRAAAVRRYLVERHGVDAARLTARGFGASKPAGPNDSAEGRQRNRRVELVRG